MKTRTSIQVDRVEVGTMKIIYKILGILDNIVLKKSVDEFVVFHRPNDWRVIEEILVKHGYPPPYGTVVDIGGHIGCYSLLASKTSNNIVSIEPSKASYKLLVKNIAENNLGRKVETMNLALGSSPGFVRLFKGVIPAGNSTDVDFGLGSEEVTMTTLDKVCSKMPKIDVLKMDAQGAEADILRGAKKTLRKVRKIVIEVDRQDIEDDCSKILKFNGFRLHRLKNLLLGEKTSSL